MNNGNGVTTLNQLESHLWEAANILRGPVDAADFKTYVFPLLFFKRISDVYDEEYAAALEESGGDEEYAQFPQNYRFQIPPGCHWSDVRAVAANVGQALQKAMHGIENPLSTSPSERSILPGRTGSSGEGFSQTGPTPRISPPA
jgi:type I restriction enzyme M protein